MITLDKLKRIVILERLASVLVAGTITLAWDANVEPDLAGYKIYYGKISKQYTDIVDVKNVVNCATPYDPFKLECCEIKLEGFEIGKTYYFVATAYDKDNNESAYSKELVHTFDLKKMNTPKGYKKK